MNQNSDIDIYYNFGISFSYLDIDTINKNDIMPNTEMLYEYVLKVRKYPTNESLKKMIKTHFRTKINHILPECTMQNQNYDSYHSNINFYDTLLEKIPDVYDSISNIMTLGF